MLRWALSPSQNPTSGLRLPALHYTNRNPIVTLPCPENQFLTPPPPFFALPLGVRGRAAALLRSGAHITHLAHVFPCVPILQPSRSILQYSHPQEDTVRGAVPDCPTLPPQQPFTRLCLCSSPVWDMSHKLPHPSFMSDTLQFPWCFPGPLW